MWLKDRRRCDFNATRLCRVVSGVIEDFGDQRRAGRSMLIRSVHDILRVLRLSTQQIDVLHHHDRLLAPHVIPLLLRHQRERDALLSTQLRSARDLADLRGDRRPELARRPPNRRSQRLVRVVDHIHIALRRGVRIVRRLVHHIPLHLHLIPPQLRNVLVVLVLHAPIKPSAFSAVKQLARVAPLRLAQIRDFPVIPEHRSLLFPAQSTSHAFSVSTNRRIAASSAGLAAVRALLQDPPLPTPTLTPALRAARGSPPPPASGAGGVDGERGDLGHVLFGDGVEREHAGVDLLAELGAFGLRGGLDGDGRQRRRRGGRRGHGFLLEGATVADFVVEHVENVLAGDVGLERIKGEGEREVRARCRSGW